MTKRKLLEITVTRGTMPPSPPDPGLAACRGLTGVMTMPLRLDGDSDELHFEKWKQASDAAKEICRPCPVIEPCREWGLEVSRTNEDWSVLGGLDPLERQKIVAVRVTYDPGQVIAEGSSCGPDAGTHAGCKRHERQRKRERAEGLPETPYCDKCKDLNAQKSRTSTAKAKAKKAPKS